MTAQPALSARTELAGRRILLVTPRFFGYHERIVAHLTGRGASAEWIDERPGNSPIAKAALRISPQRMAPYAQRYYERALETLAGRDFDDVLFVSPEATTPRVVQRFRSRFPRARLLLYMWDSFENKGRHDPAAFIQLFDRVSTFDGEDAAEFRIPFRPLFYCDGAQRPAPVGDPEYAFSFVGTIHSDRFRVLRSLCQQADGLGLRYFVYPYLGSRLLYWGYRVAKPEFRGTRPADFRFAPLPYPEVLRVLATSTAVVDVEHPDQRGLTMRTLEVLGAGQKLVTTNAHVRSYPFFSEDRVWVLDRHDVRVDPAFFRTRAPPMPASFAAEYSLTAWADAIFG